MLLLRVSPQRASCEKLLDQGAGQDLFGYLYLDN